MADSIVPFSVPYESAEKPFPAEARFFAKTIFSEIMREV
jgi:hypothetical protein